MICDIETLSWSIENIFFTINISNDRKCDRFLHWYLFFFISARGASLADFIQPSLGPLQPNLDDYMELEPFQGKIESFFKEERK